MAAKKITYIGGGATRAPGTIASFIHQGANFTGSEIVLYDINAERLALVLKLAQKMAREQGVDIRFSATTDLSEALTDSQYVLTSYRPGGFEARMLDEKIPLKHGVIGQETQGPGGFMMAMRTIHVMKKIVKTMEKRSAKDVVLVNYTNPINIVSQAVTRNTDIKTISMCEGSIESPKWYAAAVGLDPEKLTHTMVGLNHGSWTIEHQWDGQDLIPLMADHYEKNRARWDNDLVGGGLIKLAIAMRALPNHYLQYYYLRDTWLDILKQKKTSRAQDILAKVPDYWAHYREQLETKEISSLDPSRSRGGIHELELAIDLMDALMNDRKERLPVNVPNNGAIANFDDDIIVEVPALVDASGVKPLRCGRMPAQVMPLLHSLAEYQSLAADAAWSGNRKDAIVALTANPLVGDFNKAEKLFDEMSHALKPYLPRRLLKG